MDIELVNGDVNVSISGEYSFVKGIEEALQRAVLCAKIPKGSFIYNKDLGTELGKINIESSLAAKTAEMLISEALMGTDVKVTVISLAKVESGKCKAELEIENSEEKRFAEVTFSADI